jgi:hypothetical protein
MGDLLPRIVTGGAVNNERDRLDPLFRGTNVAAEACARSSGLDASTIAGWRSFFLEWQRLHAQRYEWYSPGMANEWDLTQQYAKDLEGWQSTLAQKCSLGVPQVRPTDDPEKGLDLSALKWVAGAAIVVAGVYALKTVLP